MPARVSALNSVLLPTFGSPTMPQRMPTAEGLLFRRRGGRVQAIHHFFRALGQEARELRDRKLERLAHQPLVHCARALQHVVDDLVTVARMADADADAPEVLAEG